MFERVSMAWRILQRYAEDVFHTDWQAVRFASSELLPYIALLCVAMLLLRFLWIRRRASHYDVSGLAASRRYGRGFGWRLVSLFPRVLFLGGVACIGVAVARPYTHIGVENTTKIAREVCYMNDASTSMAHFVQDSLSKAQVLRNAHLRFLSLRLGSGDRSCLWVFANNAYKMVDFTDDERAFMFQVFAAPLIITGSDRAQDDAFGAKEWFVPGEGGTRFSDALAAVTQYFDAHIENSRDEDDEQPSRALVILSDAEISGDPSSLIRQLRDRNVRPYLFLIRTQRTVPMNGPNNQYYRSTSDYRSDQLSGAITRAGGRVFTITSDETMALQLRSAFEELDRLQQIEVSVKRSVKRQELFYIPLSAGIVLLMASLLLGALTEIDGRYT